jgi:hypothetical protein
MVQVQAPQAQSYNKVLVLALVVVRQLSRVDDVYIIFESYHDRTTYALRCSSQHRAPYLIRRRGPTAYRPSDVVPDYPMLIGLHHRATATTVTQDLATGTTTPTAPRNRTRKSSFGARICSARRADAECCDWEGAGEFAGADPGRSFKPSFLGSWRASRTRGSMFLCPQLLGQRPARAVGERLPTVHVVPGSLSSTGSSGMVRLLSGIRRARNRAHHRSLLY